jgi:hypothetical protein
MLKLIEEGTIVKFRYKNYQGKMGIRNVFVKGFYYGETAYHPMPQLFLSGFDLDKSVNRDFAVNDIYEITIKEQEEN